MLHIERFTFNPFQENTYLLFNENKQCFIVDPGMYGVDEVEILTKYVDKHQLKPVAIINTHAHIDHVLGAQAVAERYNIPFRLHQKELPVLESVAVSAMMFGFDVPQVPAPTFDLVAGSALKLGEDILEVRFTPGHSPGSVIFYNAANGFAIGGDVLFAGSVGRTDLPGGSFPVLLDSINTQLLTLPGDTVIYPGHGPSTNINEERDNNPFLQ